ncbi:MAG: hypothetical protein WAW61_11780 [Methylococcaceae bacterium]
MHKMYWYCLGQWHNKAIAQEEGINNIAFDNVSNQTGSCDIWQDSSSGEEILQETAISKS